MALVALTLKRRDANNLMHGSGVVAPGATAGLPSSANHQKNLPPDSLLSYNPYGPLPEPPRKRVKHFDDREKNYKSYRETGIGILPKTVMEARHRVPTAGQASSGTPRGFLKAKLFAPWTLSA